MKTFISYAFIAFLLLASSSTITKQERVNQSSTPKIIQKQENYNQNKKISKNKNETDLSLSARAGIIRNY